MRPRLFPVEQGIIECRVSRYNEHLTDRHSHAAGQAHQHGWRGSGVAIEPTRYLLLTHAHALGELIGQQGRALPPHILDKTSRKRTVVLQWSPLRHILYSAAIRD